MMTVGLIGCGEMGTALFSKIAATSPSTYICSPNRDFNSIPWNTDNIRKTREPADIFRTCAVIFIGTATAALLPLLSNHRQIIIETKPILVSMCARGSLADIEQAIGDSTVPIFRIMPNTPTEIGAGATGVAHRPKEGSEHLRKVLEILAPTGEVCVIDEAEFHDFTVAYSCSPAFNYMAMEALSDGAAELGIPRALANTLICEGILSACQELKGETASALPQQRVRELCKSIS